jgi:hypothetical protein
MSTRSKPARWSRRKPERMNGPEMHELRRGDESLAIVQSYRSGGYFWYGGGKNTSDEPPQSLEDAKAAAAAHVKGKP